MIVDSARQAAHKALVKMQRNGGYSNLVLDAQLKSAPLDRRDVALACAIFYGVTERMYTLDFIIRKYVGSRTNKLPFSVINALRMGTYQILYMDKIPAHAAVGETVELVKKTDRWAVGFVNAVLKNSRNELETLLKSSGVLSHVPFDKMDALMLDSGSGIEQMRLYKEGRFHVQDIASQLCCMALSPQSGMRVLDVCSAPGGKSFTIAEMMEDNGEIISQDVHEARVKLIQRGAERLGIRSIKSIKGDASECSEDLGLFDRVLCDVPCSGLGVMSKKPDIKYKDYDEIKDLPQLQLKILMSAQKRLKPGGILVYSTCTLRKDENESILNKFLQRCNLKPIDISGIYGIIDGLPTLDCLHIEQLRYING